MNEGIISGSPVEQRYANSHGFIICSLFIILIVSTMILWGFAFLKLPTATPEWLLRAQYACFGSNEHGLPDGGGWLVLIGSPLMILAALQVIFWGEVKASFKELLSKHFFQVILVTFILLGVFEVIWVAGRVSESFAAQNYVFEFENKEALPLSYPKLMKPIQQFRLVDQYGNSVSNSNLRTPYFLTFAFAHCSTICPALVKNIEAAALMLNSDKVKSVYITLDPWRDTPASLPSLASKWKISKNSLVLSASPDEVNSVLDNFQIPRQRDEKSGEVSHPALVYIVNGKGEIVYGMNNASVDWLTQGMERVLKDYLPNE